MDDPDREGIIEPGTVPWFSADQFDGYLWGKEHSVWLSLIVSKAPGNGNLSKLIDAILATGRAVKVPTPFAHMEAILRRKGFRHTFEDDHGEACDVWVKSPIEETA